MKTGCFSRLSLNAALLLLIIFVAAISARAQDRAQEIAVANDKPAPYT